MDTAQIDQRDDGMVLVRGTLKSDTVKPIFRGIDFGKFSGRQVRVDLGAVDGVDSAGVALCLDWISQAAKEGVQVVFQKVPDQMLRLASMNQLEDLFSEPDSSSTGQNS